MRLFFLIALGLALAGCRSSGDRAEPVRVIFDTDMGPDFDDVGALAMLHAFADKGEAEILATLSSNAHPDAAAVISVLNTYFGRPQLPIGSPGGQSAPYLTAPNGWTRRLRERHPNAFADSSAAPDAVSIYRKTLAKAPDHSVTIITVGFFTNLHQLLLSPPDAFSPLEGRELVAQKVRHLVSMAGAFPGGEEYNVKTDSVASSLVARMWPTPILFSGFEIGIRINTGNRLVAEGDTASPVRDAYAYCLETYGPQPLKDGRFSWDQTAVWAAIRGPEPFWGTEQGRLTVAVNGIDHWVAAPGLPHRRLLNRAPASEIAPAIEDLMMHRPR
ncbi:MAG: nucleoside hydrolase [Bacteroidetes bacterium]|nr:MAG: nucleoside hydrolase [Bacteroidota bacterium]